MAEVHFIGSIVGATDFPSPNLTTKYQIVTGEDWTLLEGVGSGQTHVDLPVDGKCTVWSQPIDVHYSAKSLKGWPKIIFEVFHQDSYGRHELYGYAVTHLPSTPGSHQLECCAWRPQGTTFKDFLNSYFLGINPQLRNPNQVHETTDRFRMVTQSMGKVHLSINVLTREIDMLV